jgi:hypothetical protein
MMNEPYKKQNPIITAGRVLSALCLLLAVTLAASGLPAAFADEKGVLTYTLSGNEATII